MAHDGKVYLDLQECCYSVCCILRLTDMVVALVFAFLFSVKVINQKIVFLYTTTKNKSP